MPRDARLDALGSELDRVKERFRLAKERVGARKADLDHARSEYGSIKNELDSVRASIASERDAASYCYHAHDHYGAQSHSANAKIMVPRRDSLYESKSRLYEQMESARASFNEALEEKRRIGSELDAAKEAFNARLREVRAERERERAKWHEKRCRICGATIRYHEDWTHVPDLCQTCREREKAKWREKPCRKCGKLIRYNVEWEHEPNYCRECRAEFARERSARR